MRARLVLEDGTVLDGTAFGAHVERIGEVVFHTGMTGYQEVLSDPSYCGQIVCMTYPLIGNYGVNRDDFESVRPAVSGLVVREHCATPSHWRACETLDALLARFGIPGLSGVDTRMLTRRIRRFGTMRGILTTSDEPVSALLERLRATAPLRDPVARVSTTEIQRVPGNGPRVVVVDFGVKLGIVRQLVRRGCDVVVVPHDTTAEAIDALAPDGVLLSNGPGNPKDVPHAVETVRRLVGRYPLFGICLGHQLFALACGADTAKLPFGHRGSNHPVKDLATGRVALTAQNHGYAVTPESVAGTDLVITHIHVNDGTVEGLRHKTLPAFSVQYHPEASPGPHDSGDLFDRFLDLVARWRKGGACHAAQA